MVEFDKSIHGNMVILDTWQVGTPSKELAIGLEHIFGMIYGLGQDR